MRLRFISCWRWRFTGLAAVHLVEQLGAKVVKIVCLLELKGLHGRDRLTSCPTEAVVSYEGK